MKKFGWTIASLATCLLALLTSMGTMSTAAGAHAVQVTKIAHFPGSDDGPVTFKATAGPSDNTGVLTASLPELKEGQFLVTGSVLITATTSNVVSCAFTGGPTYTTNLDGDTSQTLSFQDKLAGTPTGISFTCSNTEKTPGSLKNMVFTATQVGEKVGEGD